MPDLPVLRRALLASALTALVGCAAERGRPEAFVCQPAAAARQAAGLLVAGSGAALPLAEAAQLEIGEQAGIALRIASSIGSRGAREALAAGDIDIALAAEPTLPQTPGVRWTAVARTDVVLVTTRRGELAPLDERALAAAIASAPPRWPDGTPMRILLRPADDSGMVALARGRPRLHAALNAAREGEDVQVLDTDQEMARALRATGDAIGLLDRGMLGLLQVPAWPIDTGAAGPSAQRVVAVGVRSDAGAEVRGAAEALIAAMRTRAEREAGYVTLR